MLFPNLLFHSLSMSYSVRSLQATRLLNITKLAVQSPILVLFVYLLIYLFYFYILFLSSNIDLVHTAYLWPSFDELLPHHRIKMNARASLIFSVLYFPFTSKYFSYFLLTQNMDFLICEASKLLQIRKQTLLKFFTSSF